MKDRLLGVLYILYPTIIGFSGRLLSELQRSYLQFEIGSGQFFIVKYLCPAVVACALLCLILVIQWKLRDYRCFKWVVPVFYLLGVAIASIICCKSKTVFMVVVMYGSPISEMIILMLLFIFAVNIIIDCSQKSNSEENTPT